MDRIEHATTTDRFYSYCLWEYKPSVPFEYKYRAANLLYNSFDFAGIDERAYEVVRAIREAIGETMTVWGVKMLEGKIAWEYYIYDYRRRERERSIPVVFEAIRSARTLPGPTDGS